MKVQRMTILGYDTAKLTGEYGKTADANQIPLRIDWDNSAAKVAKQSEKQPVFKAMFGKWRT